MAQQKDDDMFIPPAWVQSILKLGVPGAIAVFLVWRLAGGFDVFANRLEQLERTTSTQHSELQQHESRIEDLSSRMLMVLRTTCVNAAKTDTAREGCVRDK